MTDNGGAVVTVAGNLQASNSTTLPGLNFSAPGDYFSAAYTYTIYH